MILSISRRARRGALLSSLAVLGTVGIAVGTSSPPAGAAPSASWKQLTHLINNGLASVALARSPNGVLHVLWSSPASHATSINDTSVSLAGVVGKTSTVVSGWSQVTVPVAAVGPGGTIKVLWTGPKKSPSAASDPTVGIDSASLSAGSWSVPGTALVPEPASGVDAVPTGVAALPNGQLIIVWVVAGGFSFAVAGSTPVTSKQVHSVTSTKAGNNYNPVVAVDAKSGAAVAMWGDNGQDYLQRMYPSTGPLQPAPGAKAAAQDPELIARSSGGVYTAYTPDNAHVVLLRYQGKASAVPVPPGAQIRTVGLAAGPDGRIWVFYGGPATVWVTRSNKDLSRYEPIQALPGPPQAVDLYHLLGEGSAGPLELFADFQYADSRNGTYHTRVLAELSTGVSAQKLFKTIKVSTKTTTGTTIVSKTVEVGVKVSVTVTDAGDPVAGAAVTGLPGGGKHLTKPSGTVSVTYPPTTHGSYTLAVTKAGYQPGAVTLHLP